MNIILPEIKRVQLVEFSPIFKDTIDFDLKKLFIILGGNGLGKTTILQSVIYGIAGPLNSNIEDDSKKRWGRNYFKERLDNSENAFIEVDFKLGDDIISLKRGFLSDKLLEFKLNSELIADNIRDADDFFEQFITENAGYRNLSDFNYIIHKLCYLSEKRENLVWDLNSQTKILMRLISDSDKEINFNKKRALLKNIDSSKRHLDVSYNKVADRLKNSMNLMKSKDGKIRDNNQNQKIENKTEKNDESINILQTQIIKLNATFKSDKELLNNLKDEHLSITNIIDDLRENLNEIERNYFFKSLKEFEKNESKLGIFKLIHNALCPSCGKVSKDLQSQAKEYLKNNQCTLCGIEEISHLTDNSSELQSTLNHSLKNKKNLENKIVSIERKIERTNYDISNLEFDLNKLLIDRKPVIIYVNQSNEIQPTEDDINNLKSALSIVEEERNSKILEFEKLQIELVAEYNEFNRLNHSRIQALSKLYKKYASEFLGMDCTLELGENSSDQFLDMRLLVPKFNNILRSNPDSCSEAQRFFLDIALRMALIELSKSLSSRNGSFICETPESALDITYINNVSDMIKSFSLNDGNSILMSSNIQRGGIAQSLLSEIDSKEKSNYFLNMIEIGNLSDVQSSDEGISLFKEEIEKILQNQ